MYHNDHKIGPNVHSLYTLHNRAHATFVIKCLFYSNFNFWTKTDATGQIFAQLTLC